MIVLKYLILYAIIMSGAIFIADSFEKKLDNTICISMFGIIIIVYLFGLVELLSVGVIVAVIVNISLFAYTIIKNIKNGTIKELMKIVSPGALFFTIAFFVLTITSMHRYVTHWDQFAHWSFATKDIFFTNDMSMPIFSNTPYPPFPALLQYFFMKVIGEYDQGIEFFANCMFVYSMFILLFNKTDGRKITNFVISVVIICIPILLRDLYSYEHALPDLIVGALIGYIYYVYFFEKQSKFKNISIGMALVNLSLLKATGIIISGIILVTLILFEILVKKSNKEKIKNVVLSNEMKSIFIFFIIIIISHLSWSIFIQQAKTDKSGNTLEQTVTDSNIQKIEKSLMAAVFGSNRDYYLEAKSIGSLLEHLDAGEQLIVPTKIGSSGVICILIIVTILLYYKSKNIDKKLIKYGAIAIFIGLILYLCSLQLAYIVTFDTWEMVGHAGLKRYLGSFLLGMIFIAASVALHEFKGKKNNLHYLILAMSIIFITPVYQIANITITFGAFNMYCAMDCIDEEDEAKKIASVINKDEKVLGISTTDDNFRSNYMIRYYLYPLKYEVIWNGVTNETQSDSTKIENVIKKGEYDYIYIVEKDDSIENSIKKALNIENVETHKLYKLNK